MDLIFRRDRSPSTRSNAVVKMPSGGWWPALAFSAALCWGIAPQAGAQGPVTGQVQFVGIPSVLATGAYTQMGTIKALPDGNGNVYISDSGHNRVLEVASDGTTLVLPMTGLSPALSSPQGLALDAAGNLYVVDQNNARVVRVDGSGAATVVNAGSISFSFPAGIAIDSTGNLYVSDSGSSFIAKIPVAGPAATLSITGLATGLAGPTGLAFDAAGNLYVADAANNRVVVLTPSLAGSAVSITGLTTGLSQPEDVAVDSAGILYIADAANGRVVTVPAAGGAGVALNTGGLPLSMPFGVSVDSNRTLYIADFTGANVDKILQSVNFGSLNLGSTSSTIPLTFAFLTSSTPGAIAHLNGITVTTEGGASMDFANAGGGTCNLTTNYSIGQSCTVNVTFSPLAPGQRLGAVRLAGTFSVAAVRPQDSVGPFAVTTLPLATGYVTGTGVAPQATFPPGAQSTIASNSAPSSLTNPQGIAADYTGNVYVADAGRLLKEVRSAGSYSQSTIASGFTALGGVAVDGAGNLYVCDYTANRVYKETLSGSTYSSSIIANSSAPYNLNSPYGVAVDGAGAVYVLRRHCADVGHGIACRGNADGHRPPFRHDGDVDRTLLDAADRYLMASARRHLLQRCFTHLHGSIADRQRTPDGIARPETGIARCVWPAVGDSPSTLCLHIPARGQAHAQGDLPASMPDGHERRPCRIERMRIEERILRSGS